MRRLTRNTVGWLGWASRNNTGEDGRRVRDDVIGRRMASGEEGADLPRERLSNARASSFALSAQSIALVTRRVRSSLAVAAPFVRIAARGSRRRQLASVAACIRSRRNGSPHASS
uniref:Uncharacterized protein n=1 Tax=Plectus sambesii TaxID=2011161 RepID=A0A914V0R3_9BILA